MDVTVWLALLSGIAIAAACGLRAFMPLLLLGIAARMGLVELRGSMDWIATDYALIALGVATVLEMAGDKIPVVDHALDVVGTVLRPAAAWLGAYALLQAWPTPWAQIAAVVLGTTALGVHGVKSQLRLGSSAVSLGAANPIVSAVEDGLAFLTAMVAVLAPVLAIAVPVLLVMLFRRRRRRPAT
jgi:hypothetical protein